MPVARAVNMSAATMRPMLQLVKRMRSPSFSSSDWPVFTLVTWSGTSSTAAMAVIGRVMIRNQPMAPTLPKASAPAVISSTAGSPSTDTMPRMIATSRQP